MVLWHGGDNRLHDDEVAEWLRRWTANPMCSARVGSNPILVDIFGQPFLLEGEKKKSTLETLFYDKLSSVRFQKGFPLPGIEPGPPG